MKDKLFSDKAFYQKLIHLTLPIAFQSLMLAAVAACDALMLGRVEQNAMAAVSLATQIQFVQNMFLYSITSAASVLGAQYWGKGDKDAINKILCMSLRVCGALGLAVFLGCELAPRCPQATPACAERCYALQEVEPGHFAACGGTMGN